MAVELGVAYISVVPSTSKLAPEIRKQFGEVEKDADGLGKRAGSRLSAGFTTAAKVAGGAITGILGASLVKGFARLTAVDNARGKLLGLGHTAKAVEGMMQDSLASVKGTAFGLDEAATTAAGAVASGIKPGQELQKVLTLVADAATIGGTSMGEMGAVFNKVAASGKLQGDVLAQLGDRGIPIVQFLSKELGVSAEQVYKLGAAGKIGFTEFSAAMQAGLGGAALESGKTFTGALKNMWAAVGRIGANLLSGIFPKLAGALTDITGFLAPIEALAKRVGESIGSGLSTASSGFERLRTALTSTGPSLQDTVTQLGAVTPGATGAAAAFGLIAAKAGGLADGTALTGGAMDRLRAVFDTIAGHPITKWFVDLAQRAGQALTPAFRQISDTVTGTLMPALASIGGELKRTVDAIWATGEAFANSAFGSFLITFVRDTLVGMVKGIGDALAGVVRVISGFVDVIAGILTGDWSRIWEGLKTIVAGALQTLWGVLQAGLLGRVFGVFRAFGALIGRFFGGGGPIGAAIGKVKAFLEPLVTSVRGTFDRVAGAVRGAMETLALHVLYGIDKVKAVFGPAFTVVVDAVKGTFRGLVTIVGSVFSAIGQIASAAWAFLVTRVFTPLRQWLGPILAAAWQGLRTAVATVFGAVASIISAVWARIYPVFSLLRQWVGAFLGAAFRAFQTAATAVFTVVGAVVSFFWRGVLVIFNLLRTWLGPILGAALNIFRTVAAGVFNAVVAVVSFFWRGVLVIFNLLRTWLGPTLSAAFNVFRNAAATVFNAVRAAISTAWNFILTRVFTPLRTWVTNTLSAAWQTLRTTVATVWQNVTTSIGNAWNRIKSVFDSLKSALRGVWDFFKTAVAGISKVWGGLTGAMQGPIDSAKSWINSNLINRLNSALEKVGVSLRVPGLATGGVWHGPEHVTRAAKGAVLPGYTPRRDVHQFYSPTGGRLMLSGGESVMVPEWTRAVGPQMVHAMNRLARRAGAAKLREYLFGTTRRPRGGATGDRRHEYASGGVWAGRRFADGGVLTDPVGAIKNLASSVLNRVPGAGWAWEMVKGTGRKLVEGAAAKAKAFWDSMSSFGNAVAGGGNAGLGGGWTKLWAWSQANLPGVRLHSAYRPGSRTRGTGSLSYHAQGRAIDITPSMAMFNRIKSTFFSQIRELIFSPAGGGQVHNGRNYNYPNPITRADHWDHIHWAMNRGGIWGPRLYDGGGLLMPGTTLAVNKTGKPETIRTWEQEQALRSGLGGATITINGIKHDSVGEFAESLNHALTRARNRGRYAGVR